jgi:hypothetical protein
MATPPIEVENERKLVFSLIADFNRMSALELCATLVIDRCLEADGKVFEEETWPRVILVSTSQFGKHLYKDKWNMADLTPPGWRVFEANLIDMVRDLTDLMAEFHLLDNNIFQVKNVGGKSYLLRKIVDNMHHVEGWLAVATKEIVKELSVLLCRF